MSLSFYEVLLTCLSSEVQFYDVCLTCWRSEITLCDVFFSLFINKYTLRAMVVVNVVILHVSFEGHS